MLVQPFNCKVTCIFFILSYIGIQLFLCFYRNNQRITLIVSKSYTRKEGGGGGGELVYGIYGDDINIISRQQTGNFNF